MALSLLETARRRRLLAVQKKATKEEMRKLRLKRTKVSKKSPQTAA